MSSGQKLVHVEPVVHYLVCIGQEESRRLPGRGYGGYQLASQVIKRLGLFVSTYGPLVQPYPAIYCTLLLQNELEISQIYIQVDTTL